MKTDIILSGVGGQGILSIAAVIGEAALKEGLYMKQAEVHGMSQRGGDVQSNLRLSDEPIASDYGRYVRISAGSLVLRWFRFWCRVHGYRPCDFRSYGDR